MHKYKKIHSVICIILTFFLSLGWFGLFFCIQAQTGILSEQNFRKSLRESGYMAGAWETLNEAVASLLEENAIQLKTEEIIDENEAYLYLTNYIDSVFKGKMDDSAILEFQEGMGGQLNEYLKEHGVNLTPAAKQSVDRAVKETGSNVKRYIFPDFIIRFYDFYQSYNKIFTKALIACSVGVLGISILLLLLHGYKHKALRYITCSVFGAVLCNIASLLFIQVTKLPEKMVDGPEYYRGFLELYITHSIQQWYVVTGIGILIGIAGIFTIRVLKYKIK